MAPEAPAQSGHPRSHFAPPTHASTIFAKLCFSGNDDDLAETVPADDSAIKALVHYNSMLGAAHNITMCRTLVVIPGIELDGSLKQAVNLWNADDGHNLDTLLVAGYHGKKRVADTFEHDVMCEKYGIHRPERVLSQGHAAHAGAQAEWIASQLIIAGAQGAILFAPQFHILRVMLSILQKLKDKREDEDFPKIVLVPAPYIHPIDEPSLLITAKENGPEGNGTLESDDPLENRGGTAKEAIHGEHPRILDYQVKGDNLETSAFIEYVKWWHDQVYVHSLDRTLNSQEKVAA